MSSADALLRAEALYAERDEAAAEGWLEQMGEAARGRLTRALQSRDSRVRAMLERVHALEGEYAAMTLQRLGEAARELRRRLRREGLTDDAVAHAFALVRETAGQTLGMRHFDAQMRGGWIMLNGMIAEMNTGEGKTLTATLPACTMALAGVPVHVITVNDYLVARDAEIMGPLYRALGISVGTVIEGQDLPARHAAYRCDVAYATNKLLVFDYLRDRIALGQRASDLHLHLDRLYGSGARRLLLRGLHYAIVDEADSVLVDEARTPLIISAPSKADDEALVAQQGIEFARELEPGRDYVLMHAEHRVSLTEDGRRALEERSRTLGGVWRGLLRREELATQALAALHLFHKDEHYLVRDGKVQIVDEYTGRVMPDRSWQRGLHQLVEAKEGCEITAQKEPLARISYQRFFRRYLRLAGMTGTAREVRGELASVYGLAAVRVPTHRPVRRAMLPERVYRTADEKWRAIAQSALERHRKGQPVLLGTRSVAASERASAALNELGLEHSVLNAKQDAEEAAIVARAGEAGRITVATNMAGRGTDIKLGPGVEEAGGLHVILSERHDAGRVDRQLAGRCARQGDPGSYEAILSLEDAILATYGGAPLRLLAKTAGGAAIRLSQRLAESAHSRERRALLKMDQQLVKMLSFSGRSE
jgi:preprotein translocase subunit SecA